MHIATRALDVLFGIGDTDYPLWVLAVRVNVLLFVLCAAVVIAWSLSPTRLRKTWEARTETCTVLALTALAGLLRFMVAGTNLMDHGGIAYSRLLMGYKGYFGTAQFFSLFYGLTARDIEHAILFDRIAGTLTIPLVYVLCRTLQPGAKLLPVTAAFLFAVYPLHILFSASDALAIFSGFLAAAAYVLLAGAAGSEQRDTMTAIRYLGGFAGLALLTQVRYENALLLVPPGVVLFARRKSLAFRHFLAPLAVSVAFVLLYTYEAAASGLSYQTPVNRWHSLDIVVTHLVLNPFVLVPVLLFGSAAVRAYKGPRLGDLALLPWVVVLILTVLTIDSGHSAARVYANWLILILPFAGYGFSLMLSAPGWLPKAVAALALLYVGSQPVITRHCLTARHLEILENDRFRALLESPPPGVQRIIVPDDDLLSRQSHSTLEVFNKYAMIRDGSWDVAKRPQLVGLTAYLEHPQQTNCAENACVFFFGLPCMEQDVYPFTSRQCQELLSARRASVLEATTVIAAPFVHCSIYTGKLRRQLCAPAMKPRRFAVYRIQD